MSERSFIELEKKIKKIKIEAFVVYQGDTRIFEYLKNKKVLEKPTKVYSITKSIMGLLIGIMVDQGRIQNIHEPIHHYFPEILASDAPQKKEITLFHLLTMTSGLQDGEFQSSRNWVRSILEQPIIHKPGTTFQYHNGSSHLLSAIVQKISGTSTAAFADEFLFHPLGIKNYIWVKDPQGIHGGGFSLSLNVEDMIKLGFLLLNAGQCHSKQLISSNWLCQMRKPYKQFETTINGTYSYGYQIKSFESTTSNPKLEYYYASGLFGQYIFIVPKLQIMAVVKSHLPYEQQTAPRQFFEEFLSSLMNENETVESKH